MNSAPAASDIVKLATRLRTSGLIDAHERIDLRLHSPAYPRAASRARWSFVVNVGDEPRFHLTVARNLADSEERARRFAAACPQLACPVVARTQTEEADLLLFEYFAGESLDDAVLHGTCTSAQWLAAVRHALQQLEHTKLASSAEARRAQVAGWTAAASRLELLPQPALERLVAALDSAPEASVSRRWSNGDFTGRNLLLNSRGEVRLVDYEFAAQTHFPGNDWRRLLQFSVLPHGVNSDSILECAPYRHPVADLAFWLEHLALLAAVTDKLDAADAALIARHLCNGFYLLTGQRLLNTDTPNA